jgi:glycerol-1-phosphate dehydrogenase [NAD(P)+]
VPDRIINELISGNFINPENGNKINVPIKKIIIGAEVIGQLVSCLSEINFPKKISIISDENTHTALGAEIERILCKNYEVSSIVLPDDIKPNEENIELLNCYCENAEGLIAVGGGTISDIVKYSSFCKNIPYICIPTCPSVNGFSSSTASINIGGYKKSLNAHLPQIILADTEILIDSPHRLIISGLGDSLARPTAQADMLLSHYILGTKYSSFLFEIQKPYEDFVFKNSAKLLKRDKELMENLIRLLIVSGLGMHISGSSQPASGAEHLISHYMEVMFEDKYPHSYHGEQIAVTSIAVAKIQESILSKNEIKLNPILYSEKPILGHFGKELGTRFLDEIKRKDINEEKAKLVNENLKNNWQNIKNEILKIHIPAQKLEEIISATKGPYTYKHLGWEHSDFDNAVKFSPLTRNRFTFLDLAMGMGCEG